MGIRRSPDVGKERILRENTRYEMRKDQHTTFSDHNIVTQEQHYTYTDSQQRLLCGDLDYLFVFVDLYLLQESDRIGIKEEHGSMLGMRRTEVVVGCSET